MNEQGDGSIEALDHAKSADAESDPGSSAHAETPSPCSFLSMPNLRGPAAHIFDFERCCAPGCSSREIVQVVTWTRDRQIVGVSAFCGRHRREIDMPTTLEPHYGSHTETCYLEGDRDTLLLLGAPAAALYRDPSMEAGRWRVNWTEFERARSAAGGANND